MENSLSTPGCFNNKSWRAWFSTTVDNLLKNDQFQQEVDSRAKASLDMLKHVRESVPAASAPVEQKHTVEHKHRVERYAIDFGEEQDYPEDDGEYDEGDYEDGDYAEEDEYGEDDGYAEDGEYEGHGHEEYDDAEEYEHDDEYYEDGEYDEEEDGHYEGADREAEGDGGANEKDKGKSRRTYESHKPRLRTYTT